MSFLVSILKLAGIDSPGELNNVIVSSPLSRIASFLLKPIPDQARIKRFLIPAFCTYTKYSPNGIFLSICSVYFQNEPPPNRRSAGAETLSYSPVDKAVDSKFNP